MSFIPNVTISPEISLYYGCAQQIKLPLLQGDGVTPLDVSTWNQLRFFSVLHTSDGYRIDVGSVIMSATFSDPNMLFNLTAAQSIALIGIVQPAARSIFLQGRPLSTDDFQPLASGLMVFSKPS